VANTGGGVTGLDVDALTGFYNVLTSSQGIVLTAPTGLTPNQNSVLHQINALNAVGVNSTCFTGLTIALIGADASQFGGDLDQLSPEKFDVLKSIAIDNASFMTQDLDDYLAHRRNAQGFFSASPQGIDVSGVTVNDPTLAAGLSPIYSRLLAWSPAARPRGALSDVSAPLLVAPGTRPGDSFLPSWNTFFRGNVTLGQNFSGEDLDHTDYTTSSFQVGTDYQVTQDFLIGGLFSYDHTDTALDSYSSATVDSYSPGLYASYAKNGWYANALGSFVHNAYTTERDISIGAFQEVATAAPEGNEEVVDLDGGYDYHHKGLTYGPTLGFQYVHWNMDSFAEAGGCSADLAVANQDTDSFRSRVGGHVSYAVEKYGIIYTPYLDASWQHEFLDGSRDITSSFDEVSPSTFTVTTINPSRDSAILVTGLNVDLNRTATVFGDYQMQAGQNNYFGQQVQAGMKFAF
jgi:outer membrane lipase/esterase